VTDTIFSFCQCHDGSNGIGEGGGAVVVAFTSSNNNTFTDCAFFSCESRYQPGSGGDERFGAGGGLRLYVQGATCKNCSWLNCWSNNRGGGVVQVTGDATYHNEECRGKDVKLINCFFESNRAEKDGGGLDVREGNIICETCSFLHNSAGSYGGAISCVFYGNISFTDVTFVMNVKNNPLITKCEWNQRGGGIMLWAEAGDPQGMKFENCVFHKNKIAQGCSIKKFNLIYFFLTLIIILAEGHDIAETVKKYGLEPQSGHFINSCSNSDQDRVCFFIIYLFILYVQYTLCSILIFNNL
jgi:predicted outer membrane repeat protein